MTATLAKSFIEHGHNVLITSFKTPNPLMTARLDGRIKVFIIGEFRYSHDNVKKLRTILTDNGIDIVINQWGLPYIPVKVLDEAKCGLNIKTISIYHNQPDMNARIKSVEIELGNEAKLLKRCFLNVKKQYFGSLQVEACAMFITTVTCIWCSPLVLWKSLGLLWGYIIQSI